MKQVMIVDDEPLTRYALRKLISQNFESLQVMLEVDNGIEAVKQALDKKPDIIFMDIKMPGLSGIEASEKILAECPSMHIIILTAYDHFEYIQKALEIGVEGYLLKPISKDIVVNKIRDILMRIRLNEDKLEARKTLEKNVDVVVQLAERDFIDQLIQNVKDNESLSKYIDFLDYKMSYGYFICLSFEEEAHQFFNSTIIRERTRNKIEAAIGRYLPFMTKFIQASPRGNCIILFLYDETSTAYNQIPESQMIGEHLKHKLSLVEDVVIKVGIGNAYQNILECHRSFEEAYEVLKSTPTSEVKHYKYFEGHINKVIHQYPQLKVEELKEKMLIGSKDEAYNLFYAIVDDMILGQMGLAILKEYLIQLYFDLRHVVINRGRLPSEHNSEFLIPFKQAVMIEEIEKIIKLEGEFIIKMVADSASHGNSALTEHIYNYVHQRYTTNITLDDVAAEIGKTSQYTSKLFKELFGVNFIEYLAGMRLEEAKNLLTQSNLKVKEIAIKVGYEDANYFCRIFKKKMGMTPKEFRRR